MIVRLAFYMDAIPVSKYPIEELKSPSDLEEAWRGEDGR